MKKRIFTIAIVVLSAALNADAQSAGLAMQFGKNSYYGTAHTMGMGNAVTAVGGDLGSAGINPAGPSVAGYSQITFSPGVSISRGNSTYQTNAGTSESDFSRARFEIPNFGLALRFETGRKSGIRSFTFGFVSNNLNNFLKDDYAAGVENATSMAGYYASVANATGMPGNIYNDKDRYSTVNSRLYGWNTILAYDNKLINYDPARSAGNRYYGSNQKVGPDGTAYVPGDLAQVSSSSTYGVSRDLLFNFGFNVDNSLYIGFNLGIPTSSYNYLESYSEAALNPRNFPIVVKDDQKFGPQTYFKSMAYTYSYSATMTGVYGKIGVIWLPNDCLRLGAAIKTPTGYNITDRYYSDIVTDFEDRSQCVSGNPSPLGEYAYRYTSPFEANVGVAATIGKVALISLDYELTSYGTMNFSDPRNQISQFRYGSTFYDINKTIRNFYGLSHFLRVGAEANLTPFFAVRAGFNLITSPEKYYTDAFGGIITMDDYMACFEDYEKGLLRLGQKMSSKDVATSFCIGFGYNSRRSFFADVAARMTSLPQERYSPYGDYNTQVLSPTATVNNRKLFDITLTIGFAF